MIGIDLFSGAGGMSYGAKLAGIDAAFAIESDKYAAETYTCNHRPKFGVFESDIRTFKKIDIKKKKNEKLVVFGGPPCQGFSTSNQRNRSKNNDNNWLYMEFIRVLKLYMPDWFVFENVRGILDTEDGYFVEEILKEFKKIGYTCNHDVLNAENFGVPQKRARFFIVGSLHGINFEFPKPKIKKIITVKEAISDLPRLENGASNTYLYYDKLPKSVYARKLRKALKGCNNHLVTKNNKTVLKRYKHIPQGGNWEDIPNSLMKNYEDHSRCHTGIYKRLMLNEPSVVLGNYRKNMLIHPTQDRGLSVREAARLQSFPDNYKFMGSIGYQQQQVGNAVPPFLAKAVFDKIIDTCIN